MNERERAEAVALAKRVTPGKGGTSMILAAGLLAEHAEVLAGRDKIRDLEDAAQRSAAFAIRREQEHVADLTAARGITARLRAAILAGYLDVTQARAAEEALAVLESDVMPESMRALAAAFLALREKIESDLAAAGTIVRICAGIRGEP